MSKTAVARSTWALHLPGFFFLFHLGKAARKAAAALSRSFGP